MENLHAGTCRNGIVPGMNFSNMKEEMKMKQWKRPALLVGREKVVGQA